MAQQIPVDADALAPVLEQGSTSVITSDIAYRRLAMVNVVLIGHPDRPPFILIDAGLSGSAPVIRRAIADRFGEDARPAAIVLTHGHFDHVGALSTLEEQWDVPIYAHPLEHPYLDGSASYPRPDPTVGGGLMSWLAPLYPRGPINVSRWLRLLPEDGSLPGMPGWRWLHTPGHSPGHVSLWREADRSLIAGDAFITTAQESAYSVLVQAPELHGPPKYYTPDWNSAAASVRRLAGLEPERVITGHGQPMQGQAMRAALRQLAAEFEQVAVPPA